jgi:hypothetical protein
MFPSSELLPQFKNMDVNPAVLGDLSPYSWITNGDPQLIYGHQPCSTRIFKIPILGQ